MVREQVQTEQETYVGCYDDENILPVRKMISRRPGLCYKPAADHGLF